MGRGKSGTSTMFLRDPVGIKVGVDLFLSLYPVNLLALSSNYATVQPKAKYYTF